MLAVLFSLQKKLHLCRDNQNQCEWQDEGGVSVLCGGTLLIVGLGDIGLYFARLMKNLTTISSESNEDQAGTARYR